MNKATQNEIITLKPKKEYGLYFIDFYKFFFFHLLLLNVVVI